MTKFLTGNDLNATLGGLFEDATSYLVLISPYIKLHDRYASSLKARMEDADLEIIIVFGKNEDDYSKSMKQEDFNFFKEFPNIEIRYEKRLHAKYYANEEYAILTSMNLYNFSQDNNIEAGVLTSRKNFLGSIISTGDDLEYDAAIYFQRVIEQSELLYKRTPDFENKLMGLSKRYIGSNVEVDKLSDFFNNKLKTESPRKKDEFVAKPTVKQVVKDVSSVQMGFCVRKGIQIPFNPKHPMCDEAFNNWKKFSKADYPEKYCHFSGELSNGETTFSKPILRKNWTKAKATHNL